MSGSTSGARWAARKGGHGSFVPRSELSVHQQTLLAAVPRWKREWVKASTLDGNSGVLIRKWVIDTSAGREEGTEEEMQEALKVVASGIEEDGSSTPNQNNSGVDDLMSGTVTPAIEDGDSQMELIEPQSIEEVAKPHPLSMEVIVIDSPPPSISTPAVDLDVSMIDEPTLSAPSPSPLPISILAPSPALEILTPTLPESIPSPAPITLPTPETESPVDEVLPLVIESVEPVQPVVIEESIAVVEPVVPVVEPVEVEAVKELVDTEMASSTAEDEAKLLLELVAPVVSVE